MSGFGGHVVGIDDIFEKLKQAVETQKGSVEIEPAESEVMKALQFQTSDQKLIFLNKLIMLAIHDPQDKLNWKNYVTEMTKIYQKDMNLLGIVQKWFAKIDESLGLAWGNKVRKEFNQYSGANLPLVTFAYVSASEYLTLEEFKALKRVPGFNRLPVVSPLQVESHPISGSSYEPYESVWRTSPIKMMLEPDRQQDRVRFALSPIRGMGSIRRSDSSSPTSSSPSPSST